MTPRLMVLAGLPGCGKSTYACALGDSWTVVSTDEIREELFGSREASWEVEGAQDRVFELFHHRIYQAIEDGENVVADATNLTMRALGQVLAAGAGAGFELVVFDNVDVAYARNEARADGHRVPTEVMDRNRGRLRALLGHVAEGDVDVFAVVTVISHFSRA